MKILERISRFVGNTFAFWVLLVSILAFSYPAWFVGLGPYVAPLLGIVMFGMGLTLSTAEFQEVLRRPKEVLLGVLAQFVIMPLLGYGLAAGLRLTPEVAVGVILVGSCPGGTASNVMTYLARGDVALSVAITSVTTLLAPIVTPSLVLLFASQWVPVDPLSMFWSIVEVVIIPIALGLIVKTLFKRQAEASVKALPLVSVAAIVLIVAGVVAASKTSIASSGLLIFAVVILHNLLGLLLGFFAAKLFKFNLSKQKTLSIEVGMQNSGLGAAIAMAHFSPLAAVPSALFSVWHNISGSLVATLFARMQEKPAQQIAGQ
ncbi:bile acid:sodium symporter family protein [Brevibacillus marinus]|uniref:bile acid:sodium symporter family protein n=1 Tax=Brevibacillus marinus TaxID=2496837 RepID=UPI000F8308ED|nr:bile acid:sodium symporter family protein [Brevibacillus marinus]